jgi:hypothetical protein
MARDVAHVAGMGRVQVRARICHTDDCCPAIYETERHTYLVQGYTLAGGDAQRALEIPPGEGVVEIPRELLRTFLSEEGGGARG